MTGKKFENKIDKASEQKLSEMYLERMDYDPSSKNVEELRLLSNKIPEPVQADLQYAYYEYSTRKLNEKKFRLLTGYGQCRGNIVVHNGNIVICCCREMASLVAFNNAHYYRGKIYVPGQKGNASNYNGSVVIISDDASMSFRTCPYCDAGISEKIDMFHDPKSEEEVE